MRGIQRTVKYVCQFSSLNLCREPLPDCSHRGQWNSPFSSVREYCFVPVPISWKPIPESPLSTRRWTVFLTVHGAAASRLMRLRQPRLTGRGMAHERSWPRAAATAVDLGQILCAAHPSMPSRPVYCLGGADESTIRVSSRMIRGKLTATLTTGHGPKASVGMTGIQRVVKK